MSLILNELKSLSINGVFSMCKIECWLLKYENDYLYIKELVDIKNAAEFKNKQIVLPSLNDTPSKEEKFIDLYESLNKLSNLYRNENYFEQELSILRKIKNQPKKVNQWLNKNKKYVADKYVCFFVNYLDYLGSGKEYHLNVFSLLNKDLNIFVERNDFKYTIEFKEIFDSIYWDLLEE